jgi:hypothetical protein
MKEIFDEILPHLLHPTLLFKSKPIYPARIIPFSDVQKDSRSLDKFGDAV